MPPATEASNKRFTEFFSASIESSSPCLAISALLAVTTCFPFLSAAKTNFFAIPSLPPINSTMISTFSNLTRSKGLVTNSFFGKEMSLFFLGFLTEI